MHYANEEFMVWHIFLPKRLLESIGYGLEMNGGNL